MLAVCRSLVRNSRRPSVRALSSSNDDFTLELLEGDCEGIAVMSFNRPAAKNALSRNVVRLFAEHIESVKYNNDVRTVILRSTVPGIFCAGADLKERVTMKPEDVGPLVSRGRRIFGDFGNLPMPCIVALDGGAYGGGTEISLTADIRIASENALMGLTETRLAIIPGGGGTQRLSRLVGMGKAKELIYTARMVNGKEAAEIGLVEHCVPQNNEGNAAYQKALDIAKQIIVNGPLAVRLAKTAIDNGMQTDIHTGLKIEEVCYAQVIPTEDRVEALKAFAEKRKPDFKGK